MVQSFYVITRTGHCRLHYILLQVNTIFISRKSPNPAFNQCRVRSTINVQDSVPPSFFATGARVGESRRPLYGDKHKSGNQNTTFDAGLPFYDHFHLCAVLTWRHCDSVMWCNRIRQKVRQCFFPADFCHSVFYPLSFTFSHSTATNYGLLRF